MTRRPWAIVALLTLACMSGTRRTHADEPPPLATNGPIVSQLRLVKVRVVWGRMRSTSPHFGSRMSRSWRASSAGRQEQLRLSTAVGSPELRYDLVERNHALRLTLSGEDWLRVRRTWSAGDKTLTLTFEQRPGQDLNSTITEADQQHVVRAASLWQLLLEMPEASRRALIPTLELLKPDGRLAGDLAAIEKMLVQRERAPTADDRQYWWALIGKLGHERFATREAAERELTAAGERVVPYLRGIDRRKLDAEQSDRVRRVIVAMSDNRDDTPERVTAWLASDERTWLALLARPNVVLRQAAVKRLAELRGAPIDFDALAEPSVRAEQLARLRDSVRETRER